MPLFDSYTARRRVNILKKVKVEGKWKLCPAVVEPNGKLKDRVRVNGRIETHLEGTYFIEWRDDQKRRCRVSVPNRAEVIDRARFKSLELEGVAAAAPATPAVVPGRLAQERALLPVTPFTAPQPNLTAAAAAIFSGIQMYLQEIHNVFQNAQSSSFSSPGQPVVAELAELLEPTRLAAHSTVSSNSHKASQSTNTGAQLLLADAIDKFLKNVEPPNREPKTYDEYRLILYKFRDNCPKKLLHEINRDDLLAFKQHLFSIGNEARTIFNRLGIVQQLFNEHGMPSLLKRGDKPKWVQKIREMYQPEDLEALFKACDQDEKIRCLFFLLTGERDKEVRYSSWVTSISNVNVFASHPKSVWDSDLKTKKSVRSRCQLRSWKLKGVQISATWP